MAAATVPTNGTTIHGTMMSATTAERPASGKAPVGTLFYDLTRNKLQVQTPTGWQDVSAVD